VTRTLNNPARWTLAAGVLALLIFVLAAGTARAATYPTAGGSTFTGNSEGWVTKAECSINVPILGPTLCPASSGFEGTVGNPPGSLSGSGSTVLSAVGLFKTNAKFESPNFTVGDGGQGNLSLQRGFFPGGLLGLTPTLDYSATLVDRSSGQQQKAITETVGGESPFTAKGATVSLVAGHTYAVVIEAEFSASVAGLLTSGRVNFDNVAVTGPGSNPGENPNGPGNGNNGNNGGEGGNGANGLTASKLESLIGSSISGPAVMKGNKISVKGKCPAAIGLACKTTLQGMVKKGKPATTKGTSKIATGKGKRISLRVKPASKSTLAKRHSLLFKVTVKAGSVSASVFKTLKLKHS
jgi:hypothetical protein